MWLNSPVKEQRLVSFKWFLSALLKLNLEGFNFANKILKKGKRFLFPAEDNNPFCNDAVWKPLQTAAILRPLFLL